MGSIAYDYDEAGNRTLVETPSGPVTYTYDELNRLETVIDPATGTTTYTYDNVGNLKTITYPNGTITVYTYDTLNRLTHLEHRKSDDSLIASYSYTLDNAGNRTRVEEQPSGRVVGYVYDDTYKLLKETITEPGKEDRVFSYTYDAVGNRLTKTENGFTTTYIYDDNNRLIREDDIVYRYDNNGNLIEKDSAEEQIRYTYDYDNRLIRVETTRYGSTIVVDYDYDAHGNRVRKTIDGLVTTTYLVDENRDYAQVLEERDVDGNLLVRYVYGHDLISQTRNGATICYHYDGLGSTRALTNSSETVTDTYNYDAFGKILEKTGDTENHYLFAGEQFDEELGFYYLRARYMSPSLGRFVTMDTFAGNKRDPITLHKYLYANANPVNTIDPSGYEGNLLSQITATKMWQTLSQITIKFALRAMKNALIGGLFGAVYSGFDSWLGGDFSINAVVQGAVSGAQFGILATIPFVRPILIAAGFVSSLNEIDNSIREGKYAQAAFRTSILLWQVKTFMKKGKTWDSEACFTEETLIYTREGYKPIKNIKVRDEVYAKDVESGESGFKCVKQVIVKKTRILVHLFIDDVKITTTPDHPFWVPEQGWFPAGELHVGDDVQLSSGQSEKITNIVQEILTQPITVYNLEVEAWHTYFVSEKNILVHNGDCDYDLPEYDGKTQGVLISDDGEQIPIYQRSEDEIPNFWSYDNPTRQALKHAEGMGTQVANERDFTWAKVVVNHPEGICHYCFGNLHKVLEKGRTLELEAPYANPSSWRYRKTDTIYGEKE